MQPFGHPIFEKPSNTFSTILITHEIQLYHTHIYRYMQLLRNSEEYYHVADQKMYVAQFRHSPLLAGGDMQFSNN